MIRPVVIGAADASDLPDLLAIEQACFTHPWTPAQLADELAAGAPSALLVARRLETGRLLPCAYCAYRIVLDEMHVMNVAVLPDWRRLGLARALLRVAIRAAARRGARTAFLEVRAGSVGAIRLYEALGFRAYAARARYYREPEEDAILLQRVDLEREC